MVAPYRSEVKYLSTVGDQKILSERIRNLNCLVLQERLLINELGKQIYDFLI